MWTAWLVAAWAADCDRASLERALQQSESAMEALDAAALAVHADAARRAADCAQQPIGRDLTARLYLSLGVLDTVTSRPDDATGWFQGVRQSDAPVRLPPSLAGPVQTAFDAVARGADPRTPITPPPSWTLRVDGLPAAGLPTERPYLMQWVGEDEVRSRLVDGVTPLPAPAASAPVDAKRSLRAPLLIASGASAGLAVACLGGALAQNGAMRRADDVGALDAALGRQRALATGFWVFTAGTVGLGVGGVL